MKKFKAFLDSVSRANSLDGETGWRFYCGMLFGSLEKWWDDFGTRMTVHEGMDILFHTSLSGKTDCLTAGARIPAMEGGTVVNICRDLIGQTIVVQSDINTRKLSRVVLVYSHLKLKKGIRPGKRIAAGDIIARIGTTSHKKANIAPHLHLSCIEIPGTYMPEDLTYNLFSNTKKVTLINPVFL
jgi:hypothetical protein